MREIDPDVKEALLEFISETEHQIIRKLYHLNRQLRNKLQCEKLPVHTLYLLSLFVDMQSENGITVEQLAEREGLNKRTAYNIHKNYYLVKKSFSSKHRRIPSRKHRL